MRKPHLAFAAASAGVVASLATFAPRDARA